MKSVYIGIDLGTTAIKMTALQQNLTAVYQSEIHYNYANPRPGWTEIEPKVWLDHIFAGLKQLFESIDAETQIKGIGVTGQMHTTVFIDADAQSVRPAIMWNDQRTIQQIPKIAQRLGQLKTAERNAKIVSPGSPLANLLWVKENEPTNFEKIRHVMTPKDLLALTLTGVYSTDYCDASTSSMYNFETDLWSQEIFTEFEIDPELFAPIRPAAQIIGFLTEKVRRKLQLDYSIPVVAGTGDNVAAAIATGCLTDGTPFLSLGTSGVVVIPDRSHQLRSIGKNVVAKLDEADNTIITQGTVQAGAKTNSWFLEQILGTKDYFAEQQRIPKELLGENDVMFLPHLSGEKTLFALGELRGAFCGLSVETSRQEMYLAVLEGLAFGMRHLYEAIAGEAKPKLLTVVGGGAKSQLWLEIFANIFHVPIKKAAASGEAVQGAAMLVMQALKEEILYPEGGGMIAPDAQLARKYDKKYTHYLALEKAIVSYTEAVS